MKSLLLFLVGFVVCAIALDNHVLFTDRNYIPKGWIKGERAVGNEIMTVRLFLKQRNIEQLKEALLDMSTPGSKNYGKHWSIDQINDLVAPESEVQQTVIDWLLSSGVQQSDIVNFRDSLKFYAPSRVVERVFNTHLHTYSRVQGPSKTVVRQYGTSFVPEHIADILEIVTGVDDFPAVKQSRKVSRPATPQDVGYVIPESVRKVYNIPAIVTTNPKSSIGLIEFEDDNSFNQQDLAYFQTQMAVMSTKVTNIVGPYNGNTPDAESTLDVQYATAIADNTTVWFWTVTGWMLDFAQVFFATADVPIVISMSWGWPSNQQCQIVNCNGFTSQTYVTRTDAEWVKIGARGISLFAASGDQGAPGDGNAYCDNPSAPLSDIYPGASPYITSVGATMLVAPSLQDNYTLTSQKRQSEPPICKVYQCASSTTEAVCTWPSALITTGGGFNDYFGRPSWQNAAVTSYLNSGVPLPPAQYYNSANRGFPDVAGLGHNYMIRLGGVWEIVDGTSCSSPVWGAMTALINDARFNAGKPAIGFMAPMLYTLYAKDPSAFNSFPSGNNKCTESCCATYGFVAGPAWDPVTGLGTPNFQKILAYALSI